MKKNFVSKVSAILIVAAALAASAAIAGEVVVKQGGLVYKSPSKSLFATSHKTAPPMACVMCKPVFQPTLTQDTKLKSKTVMIEEHPCKSCATTTRIVGYQKAASKQVAVHTCGGVIASSATCCAAMTEMN